MSAPERPQPGPDAVVGSDPAAGPAPEPPARWRWLPGTLPGPLRLVERNAVAYRRSWSPWVAVAVEPLLYLLSIGIGVGALVGDLPGPGGQPVPYEQFVAPGLLAAAAMNGAAFDTTWGFFVKLKYFRHYDAVLATPLGPADVVRGEVGWALARNAVYAGAFLVAMVLLGLVASWWALLAVPVAVLIAFAFGSIGMAGSSFMRSFVDFDLVNLVILPLFLFSAVFFPLDRYPDGVAAVVALTPLYQGVLLERSLVLGDVGGHLLVPVAYLVVMGLIGQRVAVRRLGRLLLP